MPSRNKSVEQTIILNDDNLKSDSMNVLNKQKGNINNYTVVKKGKSKKFGMGNNNIKNDNNIFMNKNNKEHKFDNEDQKNLDKLGYEIFKIDIEKDNENGNENTIDEESQKIKQSYWESVIHKSKLKDRYLNKNKKKLLDKKMKEEKRSETHSVKRKERKKKSKKEEENKGKKGKKKTKAGKTKWIEKIEEDVIDANSNLKGQVSSKEKVENPNLESNKDEKITKNKEDLKFEQEKKIINNEKKENELQNKNIISKGRYIFLSNNKYRRKRNYITMKEEIEEAQKQYQANISLTENKLCKFTKKELGDLDSEDIEKILEFEDNKDQVNDKINQKGGFRTKILKSLQKEIGLPGDTKNKNQVEYKEKNNPPPSNGNISPKIEKIKEDIDIKENKKPSINKISQNENKKYQVKNSTQGIKKQIYIQKSNDDRSMNKESDNINIDKDSNNPPKANTVDTSANLTGNNSQIIDFNKYFKLGENKKNFYKNTNTQGHIIVPGADSGATRANEGVPPNLFLCNSNTTIEINKPDFNEKKNTFPQVPGPVFNDSYNTNYFFDNKSNSTIINIDPVLSQNSNNLDEKFISVDNKFIQSFTNDDIFLNNKNKINNTNFNNYVTNNNLPNNNMNNLSYKSNNIVKESNNTGNIPPINPFNISPNIFTKNNINNNQTNVSENKPYNPFIEISKNLTVNCNANNIFMNNNVKNEIHNNNNINNTNLNMNNNNIITNNNYVNVIPPISENNDINLSPKKRSSIFKKIKNTFESYKKQ